MKINAAGLLLCTFLVGCGGTAPFGDADATDETDTDGAIEREGLPPGTVSPSADKSLFRTEPSEAAGGNTGDGFARDIRYDGDTDTFIVDNLAFDGGVYQRGTAVSSLNEGLYAVYEADQQFPDSVTSDPINQLTHRAIFGVSRNLDDNGDPETQFAIVRTGSYIPYGFGGFVYQRTNEVNLPSTGQAQFNGKAAGLRDFDGAGGIQYSTGDVQIAIDFDDFNEATGARGDGVKGVLFNRRIFSLDGSEITSEIVGRVNAENDAAIANLPNATFTIGPGVLDDNGDLVGEITSQFLDLNNEVVGYETGTYYAIVSGDDPDEIVGVMVMENTGEFPGVTTRDTSGFIVYRDGEIIEP